MGLDHFMEKKCYLQYDFEATLLRVHRLQRLTGIENCCGKNCSNAIVTRHAAALVTRPATVQMHCFPVLAEGMSCPYCKTQRACCIAELVASRFTSVGYKSLASWRVLSVRLFFIGGSVSGSQSGSQTGSQSAVQYWSHKHCSHSGSSTPSGM